MVLDIFYIGIKFGFINIRVILPPVEVSVISGTIRCFRGLLVAVKGVMIFDDKKTRKETGEGYRRDSRRCGYWLDYQ